MRAAQRPTSGGATEPERPQAAAGIASPDRDEKSRRAADSAPPSAAPARASARGRLSGGGLLRGRGLELVLRDLVRLRRPAEVGEPGGDRADVLLPDEGADRSLAVGELGGDPVPVRVVELQPLVVEGTD